MNTEINQIIASDEVSKSQVVDIENTITLSSPYFDKDDSSFTDLSVGDKSYKEVSKDEDSTSPFVVKFNDKDELEFIKVLGVKIPRLDIKSIFIEGNVLLIEKSDGIAVRVLNSDLSEDLVKKVARDVRVVVNEETLKILNSRWEMI